MRDYIEWDDAKYSLGISFVDEQHKKLVAIINKLYRAFMEKQHQSILLNVLDELTEYTKIHFKEEEHQFETLGLPDTKEHKQKHNDFIEVLEDYKRKYSSGNQKFTFTLLKFLNNWLITHIQKTDPGYVELFRKNGIN